MIGKKIINALKTKTQNKINETVSCVKHQTITPLFKKNNMLRFNFFSDRKHKLLSINTYFM